MPSPCMYCWYITPTSPSTSREELSQQKDVLRSLASRANIIQSSSGDGGPARIRLLSDVLLAMLLVFSDLPCTLRTNDSTLHRSLPLICPQSQNYTAAEKTPSAAFAARFAAAAANPRVGRCVSGHEWFVG